MKIKCNALKKRFYRTPIICLILVLLITGCENAEITYEAPDGGNEIRPSPFPTRISTSAPETPSKPCPSDALFSRAPIELDEITSIGVLGSLIPPGHTFPTPHLYLFVLDSQSTEDTAATIYASTDMTLDNIVFKYQEISGSKADYVDYDLHFSVCDEVKLYFIHVRSLTHPKILSAVTEGDCPPSGAERDYRECHMSVNVPLNTDEVIGLTGDIEAAIYGLDVGVRDYRIQTGRTSFANPDRWCAEDHPHITERCYTACFFDYMRGETAAPYLDLFTKPSRDQPIRRTKAPVCGTVYLDIAFSAQGYWFPSTGRATSEAQSLYLGPNDYLPSKYSFSIGNAVPDLRSFVYTFTPQSVGTVNRKFSGITDTEIYCFDTLYDSLESLVSDLPTYQEFTLLLQLSADGQTLTLEKQSHSTCGSGTWSFTDHAVMFYR